MRELEGEKPGFGRFYSNYARAKEKAKADEAWANFTGLLGDVVGGGASGLARGAGESAKAMVAPVDYTDAHLTGISNSLDDIKRSCASTTCG